MSEAGKIWLEKEVINFLLKKGNKKFTTREIADDIFEKNKNKCRQMTWLEEIGTSDSERTRAIRRNIVRLTNRIVKKEPSIKFIKGNPRFWYC